MSDPISTDTATFMKQEPDSSIKGVSVRAWIAILLVSTVCANQLMVVLGIIIHAIMVKDLSQVRSFSVIGEPLYSMGIAALGFYFGQKTTMK